MRRVSALSQPCEFEREQERENLRDSRWRRRREKAILLVVAVAVLADGGDGAWTVLKSLLALAT